MTEIKFPQDGMSDEELRIFLEAISTVLDIHYDVDSIEIGANAGYVIYTPHDS